MEELSTAAAIMMVTLLEDIGHDMNPDALTAEMLKVAAEIKAILAAHEKVYVCSSTDLDDIAFETEGDGVHG